MSKQTTGDLQGALRQPSMASTATQVRPKEFYIPALDGIRAIAFLLVFFAHAGLPNLVPGGLGVTIFFFLSGYLITTLLRIEWDKTGDISLKKFYIRRCRRIMPPMYLTLALGAVLGYLAIIQSAGNVKGFLAVIFYYYNYALFLPHRGDLPTGMGVTWSLMIEEHFYFIFPLVYLWFKRRSLSRSRQSLFLLSACALGLLWRLILVYVIHIHIVGPGDDAHTWTYLETDARFDGILWGCLLAISDNPWYGDDLRQSWIKAHKGYLALFGSGLLLFTLAYREAAFRQTVRYSIQDVGLYLIFYYCISTNSGWLSRTLDFGPLRKIGQLSYAMYLIHHTVIKTLEWRLHLRLLPLMVVSFAITLGYALLIKRWVEDPLRKHYRKSPSPA